MEAPCGRSACTSRRPPAAVSTSSASAASCGCTAARRRGRGRLRQPAHPIPSAPITLHRLLDVDAYRPSGLVTPPPPAAAAGAAGRRSRSSRKPPGSSRVGQPGAPDRGDRQPVAPGGRVQAADRRAARLGVVAARAVAPADAQQLAERIAALQPESRELFLFTCAAENKHRKLRLAALGDLSSQRPSQTTFAMACRLVEAAPTWQQDRGQGARVLLLAMGDGKIDAPIDRIVAWTCTWPAPPATTRTATRAPTSPTVAACWARWRRPPTTRPTPRRPRGSSPSPPPHRSRPARRSWRSPHRGATATASGW